MDTKIEGTRVQVRSENTGADNVDAALADNEVRRRLAQDPNHRFSDNEWKALTPEQRNWVQRSRGRGDDSFQRNETELPRHILRRCELNENEPTVEELVQRASSLPSNENALNPFDQARNGAVVVSSANCENLFRPTHDPEKRNQEFIEENGYTLEMYHMRLKNLGFLLRSLNGGRGPDIQALQEVEGVKVCEELIDRELPNMGYTAYSLQGEDSRGINVALLTRFPLWPNSQPKLLTTDEVEGERGILRTELDVNGQRWVVYVNHWKSMRDGDDVAAQINSKLARLKLDDIDQTLSEDPTCAIVSMGDMNTKYYSGNQAPMEVLGIKKDLQALQSPGDLYEGVQSIVERRESGVNSVFLPAGTHEYNDEYDFLDRLFCNGAAGLIYESVAVLPKTLRAYERGSFNKHGVSDHGIMVTQFMPQQNAAALSV